MTELEAVKPTYRPADRSSEQRPTWADLQAKFLASGVDSVSNVDDETTPEESRQNNRRGSLGLARLRELVTDRDHAVLRSIREHRLLSTRHVFGLHFWNHASVASGIRACTGVLRRLEGRRLIRRLGRPVGGSGGGSASTVWAIDVAGDRLLRAALGRPGRSRPFEPSLTFLSHTLAVADARLALEEGARGGRFELLSVTMEPDNWRSFPGELGRDLVPKPDLAVTARGDYEDHWFIEVDLGTESGTALHLDDLGREVRSVGLDPERAPLIRWVFERYLKDDTPYTRSPTR